MLATVIIVACLIVVSVYAYFEFFCKEPEVIEVEEMEEEVNLI